MHRKKGSAASDGGGVKRISHTGRTPAVDTSAPTLGVVTYTDAATPFENSTITEERKMIVPSAMMMPTAVTREYKRFRAELDALAEESIDRVLCTWHRQSRLPDVAPGVTRRDMITAIGYALVEAGAAAAQYECKGRFAQNAAAAHLLVLGKREVALKQFTPISAQLYWMENESGLWNAIYTPITEEQEMAAKKAVAKKAVAKKAVAVKKSAAVAVKGAVMIKDVAPMGKPIAAKETKNSTPKVATVSGMLVKMLLERKLTDAQMLKIVHEKFSKDDEKAVRQLKVKRYELNHGKHSGNDGKKYEPIAQ